MILVRYAIPVVLRDGIRKQAKLSIITLATYLRRVGWGGGISLRGNQLLNHLLFSRDKIDGLKPSPATRLLQEICETTSPEQVIEDVVNYWCYKKYGTPIYRKMNCRNYGKLMKLMVPATTDPDEFFNLISTNLKKLISA